MPSHVQTKFMIYLLPVCSKIEIKKKIPISNGRHIWDSMLGEGEMMHTWHLFIFSCSFDGIQL